MNAFDFLADLGVSGTGFEKARMAFEKDARDRALEELRIAEQKRRDEEAMYQAQALSGLRQIAAQYGIGGANQIAAQPERTITTETPYVDTVGDEATGASAGQPVPQDRTLPATAARANPQGRARAMEEFAREKVMDPKVSGDLEKARKNMETEGYSDFLKGILSDQPVESIMDSFNRSGDQRINGGIRNPDGSYSFQYADGQISTITKKQARVLGEGAGVFKRDPGRIIPQGSVLARDTPDGGTEIIHGNAPRNDPNSPETIRLKHAFRLEAMQKAQEYRKEFDEWKSAHSASKDPAKIREIRALMKDFNASEEEALALAYSINKKEPTLEARIQKWYAKLVKDPEYATNSQLALSRAMELANQFQDASAPKPIIKPKVAKPAAAEEKDEPFVDTPRERRKSYVAPSREGRQGRVISWQEVVETARKHGKTTQQVIKELGLASETFRGE